MIQPFCLSRFFNSSFDKVGYRYTWNFNRILERQKQASCGALFWIHIQNIFAIKCRRALEQCQLNRLVIAGGVSANTELRTKLAVITKKLGGQVYYPRPEFCTDNGAMIAYAGMQRLKAGNFADLSFKATPRWPLDTLPPI